MKYALLFPGQGSQRVGMGSDLYAGAPDARVVFKKADELLGIPLSNLCFDGPDETLRQTVNTQPALYVTSCAALKALSTRVPLRPFAVAGHSVGEYAALVAAGAVEFETGLRLIRRRAELMQESAAAYPGTMAAVLGLAADQVQKACDAAREETKGVVTVANFNCPGQIVISGLAESVERAGELCKERGAKRVLTLPVSGGFHSPLMVTAGDTLHASLRNARFQNTRVPIVTNVNAEYTSNGVDFAPLLTMQVSGSVRWEDSMRRLLDDGVTTFIEIGSGDVLSGLMKRIDKNARTLSVQDMASLKAASTFVEEMNANADASQDNTAVASVAPVTIAPGAPIYHITKRDLWEAGRVKDELRAPTLETEGFIHTSHAAQVVGVANKMYRARAALVLLEIDPTKLTSEVRYEKAENGGIYPHIYGPVNVDAVTRVIDFPPGPDGRFKLPTEVS